MKLYFHSADLDGQCSAAIVRHFFGDCELRGINYGQPFPWDEIEPNEVIFMVDFSLEPFTDMVRLADYANLVWIDHHKTAIEAAEKAGMEELIPGIREVGKAGCELTWKYIQNYVMRDKPDKEPVPLAVKLLGSYDVWRKDVCIEETRDIPGYEGIYAISNTGRAYRHERPIKNQNGDTGNKNPAGWMSPSRSSSGYLQICLTKDGHKESKFIHRLVAEAFVAGRDDIYNEVNHIDGNKDNNREDNLEWVSRHENEGHAFKVLHKGASVFHGVSYNTAREKWKVSVTVVGKRYFVGYFPSEHEAAAAYDDFVFENEFDIKNGLPLNFKPSRRVATEAVTTERKDGRQWESMVLPFQYGMRTYDTNPNNQDFWAPFFEPDELPSMTIDGTIWKGQAILDYIAQENAKYMKTAHTIMFEGLKCLAINRLLVNSLVFESMWDPKEYDAMLAYGFRGKGWTVSLYTDVDHVDCGEVAKKYGGGGHKGAAGFQCEVLPWRDSANL